MIQSQLTSRWLTACSIVGHVGWRRTARLFWSGLADWNITDTILALSAVGTLAGFVASVLAGGLLLRLASSQPVNLIRGLSGACVASMLLLPPIILREEQFLIGSAIQPPIADHLAVRILRDVFVPLYAAAVFTIVARTVLGTHRLKAVGVLCLSMVAFYLSFMGVLYGAMEIPYWSVFGRSASRPASEWPVLEGVRRLDQWWHRPPSEPGSSPVPRAASTPSTGWYGVVIPHMGTVDLPLAMELPDARTLADYEEAYPSEDPGLISRVFVHEAGRNDQRPEARGKHFRMRIVTRREAPDPQMTLAAVALRAGHDPAGVVTALKQGTSDAQLRALFQSGAATLVTVGNAKAICISSQPTGFKEPVCVRDYLCVNYDRSHYIRILYRASQASLWEPYLQTILNSIRLDDACRVPAAVPPRPAAGAR